MRKNYLISLLALSAMTVSASSMAKENVTVSGSTTVLPVMQKISEHLMQKDPSVVIELSGGGSGAGEHCVFCGTSGNDGCILKHGTLRGTFP